MKYKHRDIEITFNERGANFLAMVNSKRINAVSLSALRKKIDAALAIAFKPFSAISVNTDKIEPFNVLRVENHGRHESKEFITDRSGWQRAMHAVTLDTPANRAQIAAYNKLHRETLTTITQLNEALDAARRAIPEIRAEDYEASK